MNRKHSSLMDSFFSSFNSSTYCLFYLLIPFAIHPVPDHFIAGKVWQSYGKRHKKALGKGGKVGGEGESLNKCSGFGAIFASFDLILVKSSRISATLSF